MALSEIV